MAGVAYRHGLHSSEEYRGTEDIRYGVFLISYASSSRYQTRIRWLARVGRHAGHRAF